MAVAGSVSRAPEGGSPSLDHGLLRTFLQVLLLHPLSLPDLLLGFRFLQDKAVSLLSVCPAEAPAGSSWLCARGLRPGAESSGGSLGDSVVPGLS